MALYTPVYGGDSLELGMLGTGPGTPPGGVSSEIARLRHAADFEMYRFVAEETANVSQFCCYQYNAPGANLVTMTCELRTAHANNATIPSSTILETVTLSSLATDGWLIFTGFTHAITRGTMYWFVVYSADAHITDAPYEVQLRKYSAGDGFGIQANGRSTRVAGFFSTDSAATGSYQLYTGSFYTTAPPMIIYTDGANYPVYGCHLVSDIGSAGGADASPTEVAFVLEDGLSQSMALDYIKWRDLIATATMAKVRIYSGTTAHGSPDILDHTLSAMEKETACVVFSSPVILPANIELKFALQGGGVPAFRSYVTTNNVPANAHKCGLAGGKAILAIGSGGTWTKDYTQLPKIIVGFRDFIAVPGVPALQLVIDETTGDVSLLNAAVTDTDISVQENWAIDADESGSVDGNKGVFRTNIYDKEGDHLNEVSSALRDIEDAFTDANGQPPFDSGPVAVTFLNGWTGTMTVQQIGKRVEIIGRVSAASKTGDVLFTLSSNLRPRERIDKLAVSA